MGSVNYVVNVSWGKDSLALALLMIERKEPIHSLVSFDTGWEFPQLVETAQEAAEFLGCEVATLQPSKPFDYLMFEHEVSTRSGEEKTGYGWPVPGPWCKREKINALTSYAQAVPNSVECIGIAADEKHRCEAKEFEGRSVRFPLVGWGITEKDALDICYSYGFDWGGLYNYFDRVSCYLCPQKNIPELRTLRRYFPDLWADMLDRDDRQNHWFKKGKKLRWYEQRFAYEESLTKLLKSA